MEKKALTLGRKTFRKIFCVSIADVPKMAESPLANSPDPSAPRAVNMTALGARCDKLIDRISATLSPSGGDPSVVLDQTKSNCI